MGTFRRLAIIFWLVVIPAAAFCQTEGIIASSFFTGLGKDQYWVLKKATWNFTPVAQNIADSIIDVVGDPSKEIITVTDPNTGWTISTMGTDTTLWNPDPRIGNKSSGDFGMKWPTPSDPYNYQNFDSAILTTGFINYNSARVPGTYNFKISGLNPSDLYQFHLIGSITQSDSTSIDQGSTRTLYYASDGQSGSLNTQWRNSKDVVADTVRPDSGGNIYWSVTGQDTGYANGAMGIISGMTAYEISKDSSAGAQKTQLYRNYYDTSLLINDGTIDRECIVYKPYNYDPSKSYPIFMYMDGQEDAVFDYAWDPQILTGDGMGLVGEGEKGKLYGINAAGDTCSFVLIIPQNSANEFSLTAAQMHTLLANFRDMDLYNTNDTLDLAGFSSGGAAVVNFLYTYPSEVTSAFIQSPASPPPSSATLRDTSAKFTQYGTHIWLVERGDAFANYVDSIAKYIRAGSPNNLYERYILGKEHNGFADEYLPATVGEVYPQNLFSFFVNPTENRRKVSFFTVWTPSSNINFWTPVYNGSSINAHTGVLTGTDSKTGWSINTVGTAKWGGNSAAVTNFDQVRNYNFWTNSYVQAARTIYATGSYASDGNNLQITGLIPGKSYTVYMAGFSHYDNSPPVISQYGINGTSFTTFCNSCNINTTRPAKLVGTADGSGDIGLSVYPDPGSTNYGIGEVAYWIIRETDNDTTHEPPIVNAGADKSITLPLDSVSVTGTATNPNIGGTITSTSWSVVSSPTGSSPVIRSASSLTTMVAGLEVTGTYRLELSATDDSGYVRKDTMQITVSPEPAGATVLFNLNATSQAVAGTVDASGTPSAAVITATDVVTGWTISSVSTAAWPAFAGGSSSNANGGNVDDGGGFTFGTSVTRSTWYANYSDTSGGPTKRIEISGLNDAKTYKLEILSSVDPGVGAPQGVRIFVHLDEDANTFQESPVVDNNTSGVIIYSSYTPTDGKIDIDINSTSAFIVANGVRITEN